MIEKKVIYKCEKCGNIVESLWQGEPDIVCCGVPMKKLIPNTTDGAHEKHVPQIERTGNTVKVTVGSVAHPMLPNHYILFVEVVAGEKVYRHDFKEGDTVAEAVFTIDGEITEVREYCNLHGLWSSK